MSSEMNQKSGNNSQLIQAETINNYYGITETRARQIFQEEAKKITVYTQEAITVARGRINRLENAFMQAATKIDGALEAFSDPAFQIVLRDAQEKAAATEREEDYALLSQLLICHIQKGDKRINRAGIHRAIQIVDEIDHEALCALTNIFAVYCMIPKTGKCNEGLKVLDNLFSKIMYMDLPLDSQWLDHLDILGAIRVNSFTKPLPLEKYYLNELNGYVCVGIKKDSLQFKIAKSILSTHKSYSGILIDNELIDGYVRLNIPSLNINNLNFNTLMPHDVKDTLDKIIALYSNDSILLNSVKQKFEKKLGEYEFLSKIRHWWDSIPYLFDVTAVGNVLAYTNAKRCDPSLPNLDL